MPGWLCFVIGLIVGWGSLLVYALLATKAQEDYHLANYPARKD
jgi:hypothetical protein